MMHVRHQARAAVRASAAAQSCGSGEGAGATSCILPVIDASTPATGATLGIIAVRREQRSAVLPHVASAIGVERVLVLVLGSGAAGSRPWLDSLGRQRLVLGLPGVTGETADGVTRYAEARRHGTLIEAPARDVASILRGTGVSRTVDQGHGCVAVPPRRGVDRARRCALSGRR